MQRVYCCGVTNRKREDHLFLTAQWLLRIPYTVLKNLWLLGKFVKDGAYRIWRNQGRGRRCVITTAKLHFDTFNTIELINGGTSEHVGDARGATHTQDSGNPGLLDLGMHVHELARHMEETAEIGIMHLLLNTCFEDGQV